MCLCGVSERLCERLVQRSTEGQRSKQNMGRGRFWKYRGAGGQDVPGQVQEGPPGYEEHEGIRRALDRR